MQLLCLSLVVVRCQPLRRALCTFSEDRNLWIKI
ncbi:disulfide bond formation protein DsbD, partial [Vibrio cholerae]